MRKEHSAVDWSPVRCRPWLPYAALDVELLIELRDVLAGQLEEAGKAEWARQEFAAWSRPPAYSPRPARPWRRTSGIHRVRTRRGLGYVAALWYARDAIAARLDRAPARSWPTRRSASSQRNPHPAGPGCDRSRASTAGRRGGSSRTGWRLWRRYLRLRESELPPMHVFSEGPPQARLWPGRDPVAAARLAAVRVALLAIAEEHGLPVENLLTPEYVRRLAWRPPSPLTEEAVDEILAGYGARRWQRELTVSAMTPLFSYS